jgi:putative lipoic acid-binding regulatory protein
MTGHEAFIEKLNAAHRFPTRYTFKLIGSSDAPLEASARRALSAEMPGVEPEVSTRPSAHGNHVAVTLVVEMPDAETVARLYREFHRIEGLAMLL